MISVLVCIYKFNFAMFIFIIYLVILLFCRALADVGASHDVQQDVVRRL